MKENIRLLTQEVTKQNDEIPLFRETDDPLNTARMIVEEAQELVDEINEAYLTDDLTQVAGEIGDVLYLALKLCGSLGLNADEVIRMKIDRNRDKYGGQTERDMAKREWEEKGGDQLWYQQYLLLSHETAIIPAPPRSIVVYQADTV